MRLAASSLAAGSLTAALIARWSASAGALASVRAASISFPSDVARRMKSAAAWADSASVTLITSAVAAMSSMRATTSPLSNTMGDACGGGTIARSAFAAGVLISHLLGASGSAQPWTMPE